ncbi:hypothetical protein V8C86DRAFT_2563587, partial [Haematococcus lacustris]
MKTVSLPHSSAGFLHPAIHRTSRQQLLRCPAPLALLNYAPTEPQQPVLCEHPDALKRRLDTEERRRKRDLERASMQHLQSQGLGWWQGPMPENMREAHSAAEYKSCLAQAKEQGRLLVAKFFTSDCYVCKSIFPKICAIARANPDVLWVKLNGSNPELMDLFKALDIRKVPYFHMVRDGELVSELSASLSPEKLAVFRAELAAHKPCAVGGRSQYQRSQVAGEAAADPPLVAALGA